MCAETADPKGVEPEADERKGVGRIERETNKRESRAKEPTP